MNNKITFFSLLTATLLSVNSLKAQQNFSVGNLVVVRVGECGSTPLGTDAGAVYLDEYETSGAYVQLVPLRTETEGGNYRIVIGKAPNSTHGFPVLSPDGKYLVISGYDAAIGTTVANLQNAATGRVFAMVSNGLEKPVINTTTRVVIGNGDNRVAVTSDGNSIWFGGTAGGIRYTTLGATSSVAVTTVPSATRGGLAIYNGQLYQSTNGDPYRIAKIGNGLPTTAGTIATPLDGIPLQKDGALLNQDIPSGFVFFDMDPTIPGNDLLYFVSELNANGLGNGHLRKYVRTSSSGETWVFAGGVSVTNTNSVAKVSTNPLVENLRSLTGTLENGIPTLYGASSSRIVKMVDNGVYLTDLDATITSIVTAAANMAFRGVAFAPGTITITTLPVTLTSFTGKQDQNFVKLNWLTSSEQNNSHFEVQRSADGRVFEVIGVVKGNNNSNVSINYEFKDRNPLNTTAYYRLNQVDHDGKNKLSAIIFIDPVLAVPKSFVVYTSGQSVVAKFSTVSASKGRISIYNALGQEITGKNIIITSGLNEVRLPITGIGGGKIYVALLDANGDIRSKKFIVR